MNSCFSASEPPTSLEVFDVKSRSFNVTFESPVIVNGVLAAYKIIISKRGNGFLSECVQQILILEGDCLNCTVRIF